MEPKQNYDPEYDILYLNRGKKVQDSLEIGNFVVDLSFDNDIAGLEIMDASQTISEMSNMDVDQDLLEHLDDAELKIFRKNDHVFIVLRLVFLKEDQRMEESIDLNVPSSAVAAI